MKKALKNITKRIFAEFGPHKRPYFKGRSLILAYHRVLPREDPRYSLEQPTMVVTPETFRKNIGWIRENFKIVSISEWIKKRNNTQCKGNFCAITFDDGWLDNYEYAFPILKELKIPVTIFCVSSMLNGGTNFWPGRLVEMLRALKELKIDSDMEARHLDWLYAAVPHLDVYLKNLNSEGFDQIIEQCKIYNDHQLNRFIDQSKKMIGLNYKESREVINVVELKKMISSGLVEVGSHTSTHIRLTKNTSPEILAKEIIGSKAELEKMLDVPVETFCYPNGYAPSNAVRVARKYYLGATTLDKGWNNSRSDCALLRRSGMHEQIANNKLDFNARMSGLI